MKKKPTLQSYGLEFTDIEKLTRDYDSFVETEKTKIKAKENKANWGFVIALFTWCAPFLGVIYVLNLIFKWDTSPEYLTYMGIYVVVGSIYTFIWSRWAQEAKDAKMGRFSLDSFPRKDEWNKLSQYKRDCLEYEEWDSKCKRLFWENLSGLQFEEEVAKLFSKMGYKTVKTRASNDGGVDVIASRGREKIAIQCKRYNKKISPSIARELYGVLCAGDYTSGIIATINGASYETITFCRKCKEKQITILDVNDLIGMQPQE